MTVQKKIAVTLAEGAQMVGCTPQHLRDEWRAGRLSLKDKGTGKNPVYLVLVSELERWLEDMPTAVPKGRVAS